MACYLRIEFIAHRGATAEEEPQPIGMAFFRDAASAEYFMQRYFEARIGGGDANGLLKLPRNAAPRGDETATVVARPVYLSHKRGLGRLMASSHNGRIPLGFALSAEDGELWRHANKIKARGTQQAVLKEFRQNTEPLTASMALPRKSTATLRRRNIALRLTDGRAAASLRCG